MYHNVKLKRWAPLLSVLHGLLLAVVLWAIGIAAPHTLAAPDNASRMAATGMAARSAPLRVRKIVCHAHTITLRRSPGGQEYSMLRRGDIFVVTNKYNNVWFYGYNERTGQNGWVLAQYLCDLP